MTRTSEHDEQAAFVAWMRVQHPGLLLFSIPNGAHLAGTPGRRAEGHFDSAAIANVYEVHS